MVERSCIADMEKWTKPKLYDTPGMAGVQLSFSPCRHYGI